MSSIPVSSWAVPIGGGSNEKVIQELEKKLRGRQTLEGAVNEPQKACQKMLSEKQVIMENMLAARRRWLTQNREKVDDSSNVRGDKVGEGGVSHVDGDADDNSDREELRAEQESDDESDEDSDQEEFLIPERRRRGLALSCEPAKEMVVDNITLRTNRAYSSTTYPNRIIPQPPTVPPPPLVSPNSVTSPPSTKSQAGGHKLKDSTTKQTNSTSTSKAVLKFLGLKKKKKKKKLVAKKMTKMPSMKRASINHQHKVTATKALGNHKSLSDSVLFQHQVLDSTSSVEEELNSLPIHVPSTGYQNVFDDPSFSKYHQRQAQQKNARSSTSSPSEITTTSSPGKKPQPLPRPSATGLQTRVSLNSTGSDRESGLDTPPLSFDFSLRTSSPLLTRSPHSARSESLTPVFSALEPNSVGGNDERYLNSISPVGELKESDGVLSSRNLSTKTRLEKTVSYNPDFNPMVLIRRGSTRKQKDYRHGICSDGFHDDDPGDEYIHMSSINPFGKSSNTSPKARSSTFLTVGHGRSSLPSNDTKRQSVAYLQILPDYTSSSYQRAATMSLGSSKECVKPDRPPPPARVKLEKRKTAPMLHIPTWTPPITDPLTSSEERLSTRSVTPTTKGSPSFTIDNEVSPAPRKKIHYTSVVVEEGKKARKPSAPKKFKYQTVTIRKENEEREEVYTNVKNSFAMASREDIYALEDDDSSDLKREENFVPQPSPVARRSPLMPRGPERSYYINRQSLMQSQDSQDLPTTMLSTMDPATGKLLWHEYVEIDEDEINQMAKSVGMTKSAPIIPDKLGALLNFDTDTSSRKTETDVATDGKNQEPLDKKAKSISAIFLEERESEERDSTQGELGDNDSRLSCGSSVSSECKYIFNLDEPPTVPPRPDNFDELVKQLKVRSSGDYSYAFIPSMESRLMMFGAQNMMLKGTCSIGEVKDKCRSSSTMNPSSHPATTGNKSFVPQPVDLTPPSLPPRTDSLLREQELIKPPKTKKSYLLPVIIRTKEKKKKSSKSTSNIVPQSPGVQLRSSSTSAGNLRAMHTRHSFKRANIPRKPIPYKEHQKKLQTKSPKSPFEQTRFSPSPVSSSSETTPNTLLSPRSPFFRDAEEDKRTSVKIKSHKKLTRQKSHNRSSKRKRSYRKHSKSSEPSIPKQDPGEQSLDQACSLTQEPSETKPNFGKRVDKESLAFLLENREVIEERFQGPGEDSDEGKSIRKISNPNTVSPPTNKLRGLSNILIELGNVLKNSHLTEEDLLATIECYLKLSTNRENSASALTALTYATRDDRNKDVEGNDDDSEDDRRETYSEGDKLSEDKRNEKSTAENDKAEDEEEEWLSGEEPESDIDLGEIGEPSSLCRTQPPSYVNFEVMDMPELPEEEEQEEAKETEANDREVDATAEREIEVHSSPESVKIIEEGPSGKSRHSYVNVDCEIIIGEETGEQTNDSKDWDLHSSHSSPDFITHTDDKETASYLDQDDTLVMSSLPSVLNHSSISSSPLSFIRQRSKSSVIQPSQQPRPQALPRSKLTLSSPDAEQADGSPKQSQAGLYKLKNLVGYITPTNDSEASHPKLQHRWSSVDITSSTRRTTSYSHALQMEDSHLTRAMEVSTSRKRLSAVREEGLCDHSAQSITASKSLQRTNAVVTRKRPKPVLSSNTGSGTFTHKGGRITKEGSDVTIEIPENAIPRGRMQKIRFDVVQNVYDPSREEDVIGLSLSDTISSSQMKSLLQDKREKQVQLSPMIVVGPSDAALDRPLIIRIPHCLPYRNNSWHLQMLGRASNRDNWSEIMNTIGLVQLPLKSKGKFHNRSSYHMHLDYVQIKTSQLGYFKLVGRPIRNGTYAAKKMVASVYAKAVPERVSVQIDIFINNAIEDQSYALDETLLLNNYTPLMRDMPVLCFGDGKDMEVILSNDSNCAIPLGTKAIPFGQFWRHSQVGHPHVVFEVEEDLVEEDRALTLKIQQAGSKLYHETNFLLVDL